MKTVKPWEGLEGRRVHLVETGDPYTTLKKGDHGTITKIDDLHTVHVQWDNGSTLGLIIGEDTFDLLPVGYNTITDFMKGNRQ